MPENSTRAGYAKSMLNSAYEVDSCGLGVQKQLVGYLVNGVAQIGLRSHLQRALHAGTNSGLLTKAADYGEQVFGLGYPTRVANDVRTLKYTARDLDNFVLRTFAKGPRYTPAENMGISSHEAVELFGSLAAEAYFSRSLSRHAVGKFLQYGLGAEFEKTLRVEGVIFDKERFTGAMERVMIGDARKKCISFHAGKLAVMALVTELAQSALVKEIGAQGRDDWFAELKSDTRLLGQWKGLFNEDVPTPDVLIQSSILSIKQGRSVFLRPNA